MSIRKCPRCGGVMVATPTRQADGTRYGTCSQCGEKIEEMFESPWNQDEDPISINIPTWVFLVVLGVLIAIIVVVLKARW